MKHSLVKKSTALIIGGLVFLFWAGTVLASSPPPAINYAPNLWFDSEEEYYPANPLDFYFDENLEEIPGEIAKAKYDKLSLEEKLKYFTIFYRIVDHNDEWVYQYWIFYVFNDSYYPKGFLGLFDTGNKHYGDFESIYVFVNKDTDRVNRIVGSAHKGTELKWLPFLFAFNNEIINPDSSHITVLIEKGGHANYLDGDDNGLVDSPNDLTYQSFRTYPKFTELVWSEEDKLYGAKVQHNDKAYNLIPLSEFKDKFVEKYGPERESFVKSPTLESFIKIGEKYYSLKELFHIDSGGKPARIAWHRSNYHDSDQILPFSSFVAKKTIEGANFLAEKIREAGENIKKFFLAALRGELFEGVVEDLRNLVPDLDLTGADETHEEAELVEEPVVGEPDMDMGEVEPPEEVQPQDFEEVQPQDVGEETFLVERVIDGDTIILDNEEKVRYIGINAPELPNGCFAQEAADENKRLVEGKQVRLEKDVSETDNYGRLLRYVYLLMVEAQSPQEVEPLFVNDYLVRNGYAYDFPYEPDEKYREQFSEAKEEAKENRRGLWGDACHPQIVTGPKTGSTGGTSWILAQVTQDQSQGQGDSGQQGENQGESQGESQGGETPDITPPEPPVVTSHADNQIVSASVDFDSETQGIQINLTGTAEANSVIIIEQNQIYQASTSEEGDWSQVITLNEGENNFIIKAKDEAENQSQETSLILYLDSTPPEVEISISSYNYASSSFNINWSSPEAPSVSFDVKYKEGENDPPDGEAGWQSLLENTIKTQITFIAKIKDIIYSFRARVKDLLGNQSNWQEISTGIFSKPIVINEIAWMGTNADHNDEWIELYNKTDYIIDLTGWILEAKDGTPTINLTGNIPAKRYFLLERTDDDATSQPADWYGSFGQGGLNNSGEILTLKDSSGNIIDEVDCRSRWFAGDNEDKKTMERINPDDLGSNSKNWKTYIGSGSSVTDVDGNPIFGTPKAKNSVYKLYTTISWNITQNTTWTRDNSPYLIYDDGGGPHDFLRIAEGTTLTIEEGVIVKFVNPGFKVYGTIKAQGTAGKPVVFTNWNDDEYGGDVFGGENDSQFCQENPEDSKCPQPGVWGAIWITESSTDSVFDNVILRYAGAPNRPFSAAVPRRSAGAALRVDNTSITIKNSIIEHNFFRGLLLINSPNAIIENSTFRNHRKYDPWFRGHSSKKCVALYIEGGNPEIRGSIFDNNITGIFTVGNQPIIENNSFSDNFSPIRAVGSYPRFSGNQIAGNRYDGIVLEHINLNQDYTLSASVPFVNSGYHYDSIIVPEGYTLTLAPGTIIKTIYNTGGLRIDGTLIAEGTENKPIVFTTFYDDEYGGDTNGDGDWAEHCRTKDPDDNTYRDCPGAGEWGQIIFTPTSTNSSLKYAIIRYGGREWAEAPVHSRPDYVLKIEDSDLTLADSIIEDNTGGFELTNSNSLIARTTFRDHRYSMPFSSFVSTGLRLVSSRPTIDFATFLNNSLGLYIDPFSWPTLLNLVFDWNIRTIEDLRPEPEPEPEANVEIIYIFYDGVEEGEADEYVEIENTGDAAVDLENWTLSDEADHIYTFPSYSLEPNQSIKIYTNMGEFSYERGAAVWNNTGDTAYLKDGEGELVDSYSY